MRVARQELYAGRALLLVLVAVTILPFLVLGATLLLGEILGRRDASPSRRTIGAAAAGSVLVLTLLAFAWFWPIWTDQLVTNREWLQRMWFRRWI